MASADGNSPQSVSHCVCPDFPNCEVTLVLDDKSRLSACKDTLINKCEFFKGLFSGNFRENDSSEVTIQDVSRSDMLLLLEFGFRNCARLPLDADSLCTLIRLADRFLCSSLQERINAHLDTESMFLNLPRATKLALVEAAAKYKATCPPLLETCIRLCANINLMSLKPLLSTGISYGTMMAVYAMATEATEHVEWCVLHRPTHQCIIKHRTKGRHSFFFNPRRNCVETVMRHYDKSEVVEINSERVEAWVCGVCGAKKIKETLTYEKVKQFEIDQNMIKG